MGRKKRDNSTFLDIKCSVNQQESLDAHALPAQNNTSRVNGTGHCFQRQYHSQSPPKPVIRKPQATG